MNRFVHHCGGSQESRWLQQDLRQTTKTHPHLRQRTSREKLIPGAPKMLIPGEFGFARDLHAGGNVLSLANLLYAPVIQKLSLANFLYALVIQKLSLANFLCAPRIKVIPGKLESGSPGIKIQKIQKFQKI
jgi:hypothetical protein